MKDVDEEQDENEDRDERSTTKVDDVRIDRIEDGRRTTRRHVREEGHRTRDDVDDHSQKVRRTTCRHVTLRRQGERRRGQT